MEKVKDVIEITRDLIRIESTNPGSGEQDVAIYIENLLEETGAIIERDEVSPGRYNLIATLPGTEKVEDISNFPMLVFICHMDTVVVGEDWTRDPFGAEQVKGEVESAARGVESVSRRIYGRGACDMKSGLACALFTFLETAEKLRKHECRLKYPLRLICTVDEEGFMTGVESVIAHGFVKKNDWVLDMEPTDGQIQMAHKGRFWMEIEVHGITAHASKPEEGADAVAAAAQLICRMREGFEQFVASSEMGKSTITFGQIQGGYQPYVVPDLCKIWVDSRLAPPIDRDRVLEVFRKATGEVETEIPGIRIAYRITGDRPYIEKNPNSVLLNALQVAVKEVTGEELEAAVFSGYTDTAVIAGKLGNTECMSYGPGSLKVAHKPDEYVEVKDIERCRKVFAELVRGLVSTYA